MYLKENDPSLFELKQTSNLQSVIDYFSAPNLLDTFTLGSDFNYNNSQFDFFKIQLLPCNDSFFYTNLEPFYGNFTSKLIDYKDLILSEPSNDKLLKPLQHYINDIVLITPKYNNITTLTEFFPEKVMHFENFEMSNLESDEGVFEALSTPDLKIFYPEPFIASPSFVHEDL
jgi:hypothetical protein